MLFMVLMIISMVIWGGSWVAGKSIAGTLSSETLTFWRFLINTVALLPALFLVKGPVRVTFASALCVLLGSACMGLYLYFFFLGLEGGMGGAAGVLVTSMIPLATCLISIAVLKRMPPARGIAGLLIGLAGGATLLQVWTLDSGRIFTGGNAYLIACALLWGALTVCGDKASGNVSPLLFSFLTNAFATLLFLALALPKDDFFLVFARDARFWASIVYLSVISSAFATTVYFYASARLSSYNASSFVFIVPVSALLLSWALMGERPRAATVAGGLLGITATYLINSGQGAPKKG